MEESYAYCKVAIAPVRASASDRAEIVTQLLFGEVINIIGDDAQWLHIRTYSDNYEGWIDGKQIRFLRLKEVNRWYDGLSVEHSHLRRIDTPWGNQWITRGAFVPFDNAGTFNIGKDKFEFLDDPGTVPENPIQLALEYLNTPYLWGGKTPFGIDCSALMQLVHRYFEINLPRDASQQVEHGMDIPFGEHEAGDIAFFRNKDGKVHHVGLLLSKTEIIHASGWVRIDDFTELGIVRRQEEELSHTFYCIKRL